MLWICWRINVWLIREPTTNFLLSSTDHKMVLTWNGKVHLPSQNAWKGSSISFWVASVTIVFVKLFWVRSDNKYNLKIMFSKEREKKVEANSFFVCKSNSVYETENILVKQKKRLFYGLEYTCAIIKISWRKPRQSSASFIKAVDYYVKL